MPIDVVTQLSFERLFLLREALALTLSETGIAEPGLHVGEILAQASANRR